MSKVIKLTQAHLDILREFRIFTRYHPSFAHFLSNNGAGWLKVGSEITFKSKIELEPYCAVYKSPYVGGKGTVPSHGLCSMGSQSYSNSALPEKMQIGRYCSIGEGLTILDSYHPLERVSTAHFTWKPGAALVEAARSDRGAKFYDKPVFHIKGGKAYPVIGNDVWIGQNVTLSMGIKIGDGAVVAANSTVTKSFPPFAVVGGNPAKILKYRFTEYQQKELLKIRWWDYLFTDFDHLPMDDMFTFLRSWKEQSASFSLYTPQKLTLPDAFLC
ncbi:CatB-related O-acetyltransferase [Paraglaciecola aestuariivivens]